jgi:hypothetical protein
MQIEIRHVIDDVPSSFKPGNKWRIPLGESLQRHVGITGIKESAEEVPRIAARTTTRAPHGHRSALIEAPSARKVVGLVGEERQFVENARVHSGCGITHDKVAFAASRIRACPIKRRRIAPLVATAVALDEHGDENAASSVGGDLEIVIGPSGA